MRDRQVLGLAVVVFIEVVALGGRVMPLQSSGAETRIVVLREQASLSGVKGNRRLVKRALMETARQSQRALVELLTEWQRQGRVRRFEPFWIINAIAVEAEPAVFAYLERHPDVAALRPNFPVTLPRPIPTVGSRQALQAFTWGLQKIRIPEAWRDFQVQGENVVVGIIDSGIDAQHPDLAGKLRRTNGWFDAVNRSPTPYDDNGHGTHVAGTIAGGNASGTHIGVAPKALLIAAKALDANGVGTFQSLLACMQWVMDPDGDPNTDDGADVVNNSWGTFVSTSPTMIPEWRDVINAWIAARIFPAFAIGNNGPQPRTTSSPGDYPMAFAVGATDINDRIADFSSRGPVFWQGIGDIIKPDVSAPGVDVFSSIPGGGYARFNGTSMACPHVAGTVALMISLARFRGIDSQLDVDFFKRALEQTAVDLGAPGKDNDFGAGRIDAYEALRKIPIPVIRVPDFTGSQFTALASEVEVGGSVGYTLQVINVGNADASQVSVVVPDIPPAYSQVTVLDGGTFDASRREVSWNLPRLGQGQSVTLRFQATVAPDASEQTVRLTARITAQNTPTFLTNETVVRIILPQDPFEPNNAPAQAHLISPQDFEQEGILKRAYIGMSDEDWFRLPLSPNRLYWLEVRAWQTGSNLNAQLEIYDNTGTTLLARSRDYLGRDPVILWKSSVGTDILLKVSADPNAPPEQQRGSYRLVLRDITADGALEDVIPTSLTGANALKAGEMGVVFGALKSRGARPQQVLAFNFPIGLRLLSPSQARFFVTVPPLSRSPQPQPRSLQPNEGDWLLFIADPHEGSLSEVAGLPATPLNLGRIWVQERSGSLFFRVEILGRRVQSLADLDLTLALDTDGNLDNGAEFQMRVSPNQLGLFQGGSKKADFTYLNLSERFVDVGVALSDLGTPTDLRVAATLRDAFVGAEDRAPDLGWARLTRPDPNRPGIAFGVSPAAGTVLGGSTLPLWLLVDARTASVGNYSLNFQLPAPSSTLLADLNQSLTVEVQPGPPTQLVLDFPTPVPATQNQVTISVTVQDASGNGISGQTVRLSVSSVALGNFNGLAATTVTTDANGQGTALLSLTGRVGTLTLRGEVVNTSVSATKDLVIQQGTPAKVQLVTVPPLDSQNTAAIKIGEKVTVKAALTDSVGNPFPNTTFTLALIPSVGQPQSFTVKDGDPTKSATQLPDEDGTSDGTVTITLESGQGKLLGTRAQTWVISLSPQGSNVPPQSFQLVLQSGAATQLTIEEPTELLSATDEPLVRVVGEQLTLRVRATDGFGNPLPNLSVSLTLQQGLSVRSENQTTDEQGRATFTLSFSTPSTYQFWLSAGGLRQPSDPVKVFRVQVLPPLGDLVADKVQALGLPFLPPTVPSGQPMPSLSEILGVPANALTGRIVRYDPARQTFVPVNPANPIDQEGLGAGVGFFVKPTQTVTVRPQRGRLPDRDFVEVTLQRGWNLVSFPIAVEFPWILANIQVRTGTTTRPLTAATDTVLPLLWRWDGTTGSYRAVFDGTLAKGDFETTIRPWSAYFVYAFQPTTLVVPVPVGARTVVAQNRPNPNWRLFTLRARQGQATTTLVLGLSDGSATLEMPAPPAPTDAPRIALLGTDGTPVALAVRPRQSRLLWSLVVQGKEDGEEARVGSDNLAALPADLQLRLVDLTTGEQRSLRTGEWRATLKAGETRPLLLVAEPRNGVGLRVQQVKAIPLRGRGALVSFALTANAQTEVAIFSLTGRLIRLLDKQTYRQAGSHQLRWDGTDAQGHPVPKGAYLVRVRAHDEQGQIAQSGTILWLR